MEQRKPTYEIMRDVVLAMNKTIVGKPGAEWTDNGNGTFTLLTCATLWATEGKTVTISGSSYRVVSVINNISITVSASAAPVSTSAILTLPFFWHGTIRFINDELSQVQSDNDKFPMIFLHEPTKEYHNYNPLENEGMRSECDFYFMKPADFSGDWTNEQHYSNAVAPMRNMCNEFVRTLRSFPGVMDTLFESTIEDRVMWGKAVLTGNFPDLISGELSGTSLKISPQFEKRICKCEC